MKRADLPGFTYVFCKVKSLIQSDFLTKISWFVGQTHLKYKNLIATMVSATDQESYFLIKILTQ